MHLKPSCHRAGNNDQAFPTPNATRLVPARCARTTRSPAPVRGTTSPSTPHPAPWREEASPKAESLWDILFFLLLHVLAAVSGTKVVRGPSANVRNDKVRCWVFDRRIQDLRAGTRESTGHCTSMENFWRDISSTHTVERSRKSMCG